MSAFECVVNADCAKADCGGGSTDSALCDGGLCKCEPRSFFFIVFGLYIATVITVAIYSYHLAKQAGIDRAAVSKSGTDGIVVDNQPDDNDGAQEMSVKSSKLTQTERSPQEVLMDHFMPRARFGVITIALTLFSTMFSGYSVIGIPQEAFQTGFVSLRWLLITLPGITAMLVFYPRFRRVGLARHYASPSDIFADRFNCQVLRLLVTMIMLFVQFIFTAAQFKAIYEVIDVVSLGRIDAYETTFFLGVVIVICDWIGGQRGIALSDSVQASMMLLSFMVLPILLSKRYRGISSLMADCDGNDNCISNRRPWFKQYPTSFGTCFLPNNASDPNCYASHFDSQNEYRTGTRIWGIDIDTLTAFDHQALSMFGFLLNSFAFPMQTHFLQKLFLARSEWVLKQAFMFLAVSSFLVYLPSLFYGMLVAADFSTEDNSPLPLLCGKLMNASGFDQFIAVIALNAILAAIMSTADSTVIGGCNVWVCTWVKGFLLPNQSAKTYQRISFVTTPIIALSALTFAVHAQELRFDTLISIQNSVNWQAIPAFTCAMYSDKIAAYPLIIGMVVGLLITIALEIQSALDHNDNEHHDNRHRFDPYLPSGIWGVMANICVTYLSQWLLQRAGSTLADDNIRTFDQISPEARATYGEKRLTAAAIHELCNDADEPLRRRGMRLLTYVQLGILVLSLPWYRSPFASSAIAAGGFPSWAGGLFTTMSVCTVVQLYVIWSWEAPKAASVLEANTAAAKAIHALASINSDEIGEFTAAAADADSIAEPTVFVSAVGPGEDSEENEMDVNDCNNAVSSSDGKVSEA